MAEDTDVDRIWKLIDKIGFCMLSTFDGDLIRARPMAAYADRAHHAIWFLTDAKSHKDEEIARNPTVGLAFADAGSQKYVSVTGRATLSDNRRKIKDLWSTPAKAWWASPDDPDIRVLRVEPIDAQYWDSPGALVAYVKMFAAALSGGRPEIGERGKTAL